MLPRTFSPVWRSSSTASAAGSALVTDGIPAARLGATAAPVRVTAADWEGVPGIVGGFPKGEENRGGSRGPDSGLESGSKNPNRRPPR